VTGAYISAVGTLVATRYDARLPAIAEKLAALAGARIRPFAAADAWDVPRDLVSAALLALTAAGLLTLEWTPRCPFCRAAGSRATHLGDLPAVALCSTCGRDFELEFDRTIEVTFAPPAGVAPAERDDAVLAVRVGAVAASSAGVALPPGTYVVDVDGDPVARLFVASGMPAGELSIVLGEGMAVVEPPVIGPGHTTIRMRNAGAEPATVRVRESAAADRVATAADITRLEEFAALPADATLGGAFSFPANEMTVVACDCMAAPTDAVRALVAYYRGGIVLCVSDVLIAAFRSPLDALDAALSLQTVLRSGGTSECARVGMYRGRCDVRREGDRLTYTGRTVNIAAALAHAARLGDVVVAHTVTSDAAVAERLAALNVEPAGIRLRGYPEPVDVDVVAALETVEV
jgi:hypothetical protein